jgi:hypothetical protein
MERAASGRNADFTVVWLAGADIGLGTNLPVQRMGIGLPRPAAR